MKNSFKMIIMLFVVLSLLTGCSQQTKASEDMPIAKEGVLDLRNWDFDQVGSVKLNGEWEFYWEQLYLPHHFTDIPPTPTGIMKLPSTWNGYVLPSGEALSGEGYATYRLVVDIGNSNNTLYGIHMPSTYTNYQVWVNGKLLGTSGQVGATKEEAIPERKNNTYIFDSYGNSELEFIIQISNFHHTKGGFFSGIELGEQQQITKATQGYIAVELIMFGSLIIMGVYHLVLFGLGRNEKSVLFLGLVCVLFSIRSLLTGEIFFSNYIILSYEILKKLEYLTYYMSVPLFVLYIAYLYKQETPFTVVKISTGIGIVFSLLVLVTPSSIYSQFNTIYHVYTFALIPVLEYVLFRAIRNKRVGAVVSFVMFNVYAATVVNDMLYYNQIIDTHEIAIVGLFMFLFAQAVILSVNFSNAYKQVEDLSEKQRMWQNELENIVDERTKELRQAMQHLKKTQSQLVESEKMSALGGLVAGVAHEVNTPIGIGITAISYLQSQNVEFLKKYDENKLRRADLKKYLETIEEATNIIQPNLLRASELVKSFKQVAVDQSSETKRIFALKKYLEDVIISLKPETKKKNIHFEVICDEEIVINSYPGALSQMLTNLIMNSLIHAFEDKGIIRIEAKQIEDTIIFTFEDNGKGMKPEIKERIFDPFFTTKRGSGGTGLGLHILYNIVTQNLKGELSCESTEGVGTKFIIQFPIEA